MLNFKKLLGLLLICCACFAAEETTFEDIIQKIKMEGNVTITESQKNNKKNWEVVGKRAETLDSNRDVIRIYNVTGIFIDDNNEKTSFWSDYVDVDMRKRDISTDTNISIIYNDVLVITGVGMFYNDKERKFEINKMIGTVPRNDASIRAYLPEVMR